jgi:quercetin dioxygenase-like cupin family protein
LKKIDTAERRVTSIYDESAYSPVDASGVKESGTSFIQLNQNLGRMVGFYIYRMAPGAQSEPHQHGGAEEFFVIEGEVIDNDGTVYKQGDVVWLGGGTEHTSVAPNGAIVAVFSEKTEAPVGA